MSKIKLKKMELKIDRNLVNAVVQSGSKKATWSALDHLASVSKQQVPLDTGALSNSCVVDVSDDGSEGTVSYDTPYAVVQHENHSYNHQRGRKAKYLEDPCYDSTVQKEMLEVAGKAFGSELR